MARTWDAEEETLLAEMWQTVAESQIHHEEHFWNVVTEMFNEHWNGPNRNKNQLTGKWQRMNNECQLFHAIHASLQPTPEPWGRVENAANIFKERNDGREFKYFHVWMILRSNHAWNRAMG